MASSSLVQCTCTGNGNAMSQQSRAQAAFQLINQRRKTRKTLPGIKEQVWPPELEEALLEGLAAYQPVQSRETVMLGRHPNRNLFLSDYIRQRTGKFRNSKQIGSRLQQLRDTYGGEDLQSLLAPCRYNAIAAAMCPLHSASRIPQTLEASQLRALHAPSNSRITVTIEIFPTNGQYPTQFHFPSVLQSGTHGVNPSSSRSLPLYHVDPTIAFTFPSNRLLATSVFSICFDGSALHFEDTSLSLASQDPLYKTPTSNGLWVYTSRFIPGGWNLIRDCQDPTRYTVFQDVFSESTNPPGVIFSAMYRFVYAQSARAGPISPTSSSFTLPSDISNYLSI